MTATDRQRVLLLSGGVGGAKLAHGFEMQAEAVELTVVVNVGDDFEHLGLTICPDIDTVLYTLAGIANRRQGWGLEGETWRTLERLGELGGEDWFRLGDLDLATHLVRTAALSKGETLLDVVQTLATKLGIRATVFPATNQRLRTRLSTTEGLLDFQHYFVRERCEPVVREISYAGAELAQPPEALVRLIEHGAAFDAVVLAPSNPFLSLAPILAVPGLADLLRAASPRVVAVSPIIAGRAVKGPAAKMMGELSLPVSASGWAQHLHARYPGMIDEWVLDNSDVAEVHALKGAGFNARATDTIMTSDVQRQCLARWLMDVEDGYV